LGLVAGDHGLAVLPDQLVLLVPLEDRSVLPDDVDPALELAGQISLATRARLTRLVLIKTGDLVAPGTAIDRRLVAPGPRHVVVLFEEPDYGVLAGGELEVELPSASSAPADLLRRACDATQTASHACILRWL